MNGSGAIPMSDRDLAHLLLAVAHAWPAIRCNNDDCEPCLVTRRLWWDTWMRLDDDHRLLMAERSMLEGILYPPSPPVERVG